MKRTAFAAFALSFTLTSLNLTTPALTQSAKPAPSDLTLIRNADAVSAATEFLSNTSMKSASDDHVAVRALVDELGQQHVRFVQTHKGLTVYGSQVITHRQADGRFTEPTTTGITVGDLDVNPVVKRGNAIAIAQDAVGTTDEPRSARLAIFPRDGVPALVWEVTISTIDEVSPHEWTILVDASASRSGVMFKVDGIHTGKPTGSAPVAGDDMSLYSGTVSIKTFKSGRMFEIRDTTRGNTRTTNLNGLTSGPGTPFSKNRDNWGTGTMASVETDAVDAQYAAEKTFDYLKNVLGRDGVWNTGEGVLSRVNYGTNYNNAFWNDAERTATYGRGNGVNFNALTSIDVCAHEIQHGVTRNTAYLVYHSESGALNESMSDVFGTVIEHYARGQNAQTGNWTIGEDCYTPNTSGDALRYMYNPNADGYTPNYYYPTIGSLDVHNSSGIGNLAFYLVAHGGSNVGDPSGTVVTGIDDTDAAKIWYRALSVYMVPTETYSMARQDTLRAAADLFGDSSPQYAAVAAAWTAVGVF